MNETSFMLMSKTDDSLALLPNGFVDILPPDAEGEANSITVLMETFRSFGYRRIKPPIFEFEDSLLAPGPGEGLASETFRLMDPMSHRMLGVRSDITAQVARIVSSRLGNEPRPLRLTYANDALRTRGSQMRTERQFTQVGCELVQNIGESHADVEICVLSLLGLKALGIKDITLDLTIPGFVASLMKDIPEGDQDKAAKAVEQRDVAALKALSSPQAQLIAKAMESSGNAEKALKTLRDIDFDSDIKSHIDGLKAICDGIEGALKDLGIDDVDLSIDLIEQKGFEYHKAYGFTLFSATSSGELGRGGAYDIHFGQKAEHETARGFTLYMDTISKFTRAPAAIEAVFVPADTPWNEIKKLQEDGHIIVRGTADSQSSDGCSHIYKNGTVEKLS